MEALIQKPDYLVGKKFHMLTVISLDFREKSHSFWKCKCECGKEKTISQCSLLRNRTKSCGCWVKVKKAILLSNIKQRLQANIEIKNDCWIWNRGKDKDGYGTCGLGYGDQRSHRASYKAFIGEIPKGLFVCHHCDNPSCINPNHLFLGTNKDNMVDASRKGRLCTEKNKNKGSPGEKNFKAKLANKDIFHIRSLFEKGFSSRDLSIAFQVCPSQIRRIVRRELWNHL